MQFRHEHTILIAIWSTLAVAFVVSLATANWPLAFISAATAVASVLPRFFADRLNIRLPSGFYVAIVLFVFGTIFLGEAFDFYRRYWWWDMLMHFGSAMGFGIIGFLLAMILFEGDRYAAPPLAIAVISFGFAVMIGTAWEIFEFAMDQAFGLNMQKSGLPDTMGDLIVNAIGAGIAATAGWLHLKGLEFGGFAQMIEAFVRINRERFRKWK